MPTIIKPLKTESVGDSFPILNWPDRLNVNIQLDGKASRKNTIDLLNRIVLKLDLAEERISRLEQELKQRDELLKATAANRGFEIVPAGTVNALVRELAEAKILLSQRDD